MCGRSVIGGGSRRRDDVWESIPVRFLASSSSTTDSAGLSPKNTFFVRGQRQIQQDMIEVAATQLNHLLQHLPLDPIVPSYHSTFKVVNTSRTKVINNRLNCIDIRVCSWLVIIEPILRILNF